MKIANFDLDPIKRRYRARRSKDVDGLFTWDDTFPSDLGVEWRYWARFGGLALAVPLLSCYMELRADLCGGRTASKVPRDLNGLER